MSEWYSNGAIESRLQDIKVDSELINLLNEVKLEQTTAHFDKWFNGDEKLTGSFGKAIVAMRDDKPVIYSNWDSLYRLVKEKRLTLHGTLHSYCKNGYECDMDGVINAAFCVDCRGGGSVVDDKKSVVVAKETSSIERLSEAAIRCQPRRVCSLYYTDSSC
ncbi:hypothetical protein [Xenorhabdus nematophila]|uniref:hypothetical protein n=1 Tax=Xenorhabdus nematophila TaxID=628 RepID=UPI000B1B511C|nr:hypothetical protein [Xenorhabdus nematophila]